MKIKFIKKHEDEYHGTIAAGTILDVARDWGKALIKKKVAEEVGGISAPASLLKSMGMDEKPAPTKKK